MRIILFLGAIALFAGTSAQACSGDTAHVAFMGPRMTPVVTEVDGKGPKDLSISGWSCRLSFPGTGAAALGCTRSNKRYDVTGTTAGFTRCGPDFYVVWNGQSAADTQLLDDAYYQHRRDATARRRQEEANERKIVTTARDIPEGGSLSYAVTGQSAWWDYQVWAERLPRGCRVRLSREGGADHTAHTLVVTTDMAPGQTMTFHEGSDSIYQKPKLDKVVLRCNQNNTVTVEGPAS